MAAARRACLLPYQPIVLPFQSPSFHGIPGGRVRFVRQSLLGYMMHYHGVWGRTDFAFDLSVARGEVSFTHDRQPVLSASAETVRQWLLHHKWNVGAVRASETLVFWGYSFPVPGGDGGRHFYNCTRAPIPYRSCEAAVCWHLDGRGVASLDDHGAAFVTEDRGGGLRHHYVKMPAARLDVRVTDETHFDLELLNKIRRFHGANELEFWLNEYEPWRVAYLAGRPEQENPTL